MTVKGLNQRGWHQTGSEAVRMFSGFCVPIVCTCTHLGCALVCAFVPLVFGPVFAGIFPAS